MSDDNGALAAHPIVQDGCLTAVGLTKREFFALAAMRATLAGQ